MENALFPYLAAGLGFISVLLAGYGVVGYLSGTSESARLKERVVAGTPDAGTPPPSPLADLAGAIGDWFERMGSKIGPKDAEEVAKSRLALVQAGLRTPGAVLKFQGAKGALALILGCVFLVARFLLYKELPLPATCFGVVALAAAGIYGPEFWLKKRIAKRQLAVANELPDALDLLVVCVESGMGLDQAIERVSSELRHSGPIISSELKLLTLELRAGKARAEALRSLSERVGLDDLNSLTSLLVQADMFGIGVGRTLRVYSDSMRLKRTQRAEEKAAKLPVLLLLPLIGFIFPALFVAIMGPSVLLFIDIFAKLEM